MSEEKIEWKEYCMDASCGEPTHACDRSESTHIATVGTLELSAGLSGQIWPEQTPWFWLVESAGGDSRRVRCGGRERSLELAKAAAKAVALALKAPL